ncbi:Caffeoyl-CoA O-methyltransferase 1 [Rhynchospora pubera]|uniref:Caffeoyl-CoA O-methyltransferase 1 n=1 Tax=Rhynchospora pubera TaxID=906938 RepID=A0AAV8GJH5_9POAL|nr:Caffeoyl-CoA O-methyltransferase 1 [Rhynchospora pubera]
MLARFGVVAMATPLAVRLPPALRPPLLSSKLSTSFPPFLSCPPKRLLRSLPTDTRGPVVVADDGMYGRKQVVSLTPQLYHYVLSNILRDLREETSTMHGSQMQVSPDQAQLLAMLVQIMGAKKCIEVGIYTGYSSLAVALALPDSGRLVACERDGRCLEVAKRFYEQAGVSHKVDVRHALAVDTLNSLILSGETNSYDFAFVDADKRMYNEYFELLFQLVRTGGLIIMDNVLWHGKVADPGVNDPKTVSLRNFNRKILEDKRISISMVPIGDGMTICRKIADTSAQGLGCV